MWKEKVLLARDFIVSKSKFVFPIIVIVVVAMTVTVALQAGNVEENEAVEESQVAQESTEQALEPQETMIPLVANENSEIYTLIETFYNAQAAGDEETLKSVCDEISDKDLLRYLELAKYTKSFPTLEIYTKPGFEEGSTIAYVYYKVVFESYEDEIPGYQAHYICTDDQGKLYLKRSENSDEVNEYFKAVSVQDDVVEFNNRINVEYNELMDAKPELLVYLKQLGEQVDVAVGEGLAQLASQQESTEQNEAGQEGSGQEGAQQQENTGETSTEEQPTGELYATATTTVNVRSSDSEQADKLGKVAEGTRIQVLEQRVNGWSKVLFETKEGYIKSEFLQVEESTQGAENSGSTENAGTTENVESVGTVTATTNVNIRASASENADKIGTLVGGATAQLIAKEGDWCKIKYDGEVGYVKAEYVQ